MASLRSRIRDWQITKDTIRDRFDELLSIGQWTDCAFSVGTYIIEEIRCHKLVLAVSSPVFEALFFGGLSNPNDVIRIPDVEPSIFKLFLKYVYADSVDLNNIYVAGNLLYVAKKYLMPKLSKICLDYLFDTACLSNIWDNLTIAETLNETELLDLCIKFMCGHSYDVWYDKDQHLSKTTFLKLLEQKNINMNEEELWTMALDWAKEECEIKEIEVSGDNMRKMLKSSGILNRIHFLEFSCASFCDNVIPTGVLSKEECAKFKSILERPIDKETLNSKLKDEIPPGLCPTFFNRNSVAPVTWRYARDRRKWKGRLVAHGGPITTKISSSTRVLITGFEVLTRFVSNYLSVCDPLHTGKYRECQMVLIKDDDQNVISKTDYIASVPFNGSQIINLTKPFWFEANVPYTIVFVSPTGQYPVGIFTDTIEAKGTTFKFEENIGNHGEKSSYIMSILYSL